MSADGRRAVFTVWSDQVAGKIPQATYVLWRPDDSVNDRLGAQEIERHASRCADDPAIEALGIQCDPADRDADPRIRKDYRRDHVLRLRVDREADGTLVATILDKCPVSTLRAVSGATAPGAPAVLAD
jgi:hypothetical protein